MNITINKNITINNNITINISTNMSQEERIARLI
jgi:hypothetical protein